MWCLWQAWLGINYAWFMCIWFFCSKISFDQKLFPKCCNKFDYPWSIVYLSCLGWKHIHISFSKRKVYITIHKVSSKILWHFDFSLVNSIMKTHWKSRKLTQKRETFPFGGLKTILNYIPQKYHYVTFETFQHFRNGFYTFIHLLKNIEIGFPVTTDKY